MIAFEICKDLNKMQAIIAGLIEFDSTNKIENKYDRAVIFADKYNSGQEKPGPCLKHGSIQRPTSGTVLKTPKESKKSTVGSTLTRNEGIRKRQYYRKQFFEFIMIGIREKYSK